MKAYELKHDVTVVNLRDGIIYEWDFGRNTMTLLELMEIDNLQLTNLHIVVHIGCR
jgi:hypothetical protein